ncbi:MAG: tRNA pseudouridine(38-40) synthase TruA [Eubacteriales bacterium]|nr:tRNA pseudouridine(38-40) synthase TruA [Eubacteriales bacterium]
MTIEYDGTGFSGWQRQPGKRTVQGLLEESLSRLMGTEVLVTGVSRTDAGVHALGQRAVFEGDFGIPTDRIPVALNSILKGRSLRPSENSDLRIVRAEDVQESFAIRGDSKGKEYRYLIRNSRDMSVFERNRVYQVKEPLDIERMRRAASYITGTRDFICFRAAGANPDVSTVKTIYSLDVDRDGDLITITVRGTGFLYNMVRIIAGTLVDVGAGRMEPDFVEKIIESKDRRLAGHTAPPQGLYLVKVFYDDSIKQSVPGADAAGEGCRAVSCSLNSFEEE